jgi:uncharacterized protein DUF839
MRTKSLLGVTLAVGGMSVFSFNMAAAAGLTPLPNANTRVAGEARPNALSPELSEILQAQGANALENPTANNPLYGYDGDGPMVPAPGDVQSETHNVEASKTEPDKNTYLVLDHATGADAHYDYGHHFVFQGHESAVSDDSDRALSFISRVNLDADEAHRVTLIADHDTNGAPISTIDGSTWDPFAQRLLFTTEDSSAPSVYQATLDVPATVDDLTSVFGHGAYEGIQNDSNGNVWLVEDASGAAGAVNKHAKQPNSFVYRFVPKDPRSLAKGGKLQVLQLQSLVHAGAITFHPGDADGDILSQDVRDEHTYGKSFNARFVTIHDTATDGTASFDANALAKAAGGTPFKRPENGVFRPGSRFTQFFFSETGDTNAQTEAGSDFGGFGGVFKVTLSRTGADAGTVTPFYVGDVTHTGLDNCNFLTANGVVFVEDAGAGLHQSRNALDSAWLFDVRDDFGKPQNQPVRILAEGRDASATIDAGLAAAGHGFQNEDDNEITGFHVSDGDPGPNGILGAKIPLPFVAGWRVFYTAQHGDNDLWEIVPSRPLAFLGDQGRD